MADIGKVDLKINFDSEAFRAALAELSKAVQPCIQAMIDAQAALSAEIEKITSQMAANANEGVGG